jgi:hypothetical protein
VDTWATRCSTARNKNHLSWAADLILNRPLKITQFRSMTMKNHRNDAVMSYLFFLSLPVISESCLHWFFKEGLHWPGSASESDSDSGTGCQVQVQLNAQSASAFSPLKLWLLLPYSTMFLHIRLGLLNNLTDSKATSVITPLYLPVAHANKTKKEYKSAWWLSPRTCINYTLWQLIFCLP